MTSSRTDPIFVRLQPAVPGRPAYRFSLAGRPVICDSRMESVLAPRRAVEVEPPRWRLPGRPGEELLARPPYASLEGFVAGRQRQVAALGDESLLVIRLQDLGDFSLDSRGILRLPGAAGPEGGAGEAQIQQAALGPLLILVLALRGVFCLHCSAAARGAAGACLFLGESGAGKSTLGTALGKAGWDRLADDILPLELTGGKLIAWTDFPQLKECVQPARACLPVHRCYVLAEGPQIRIEALTEASSAVALAANTAAARLFPPSLLARHLGAMGDGSGRVPVRRLIYPRRRDALPGLERALRQDLAADCDPGLESGDGLPSVEA